MSSAAYEPVATTEETSSSPPTRSRKYRVVAVVVLSILILAPLYLYYKLGPWVYNPSPQTVASRPPTTPPQSDNKTVMPHGKYSVG